MKLPVINKSCTAVKTDWTMSARADLNQFLNNRKLPGCCVPSNFSFHRLQRRPDSGQTATFMLGWLRKGWPRDTEREWKWNLPRRDNDTKWHWPSQPCQLRNLTRIPLSGERSDSRIKPLFGEWLPALRAVTLLVDDSHVTYSLISTFVKHYRIPFNYSKVQG